MNAVNIILWISILWLPVLIYAILKNEAQFKKNIVIGVTLPKEVQKDEEVQHFLSRFVQSEKKLCLVLTLTGFLFMLLPVKFGLSMTIFLIWLNLGIILPYVPYARCNSRLKALKRSRGWANSAADTVTVDLSAAGNVPVKELSVFHFLLPLFISLIPCIWEILCGSKIWGGMLTINSACIVLFYLCYRFVFRRKSERVDENTTLTEALTRLRYLYWRRMWLYSSWFMVAYTFCMWAMRDFPALGIIATAAVTVLITVVVLRMEFRLRHNQEKLTASNTAGTPVDEDDYWLWGILYHNPNDSHLFINQRTGGNVTFNLARRAGKVITVILTAVLLLMPLIGIWLMGEENSAVTLTIEDNVLHSSHFGTSYRIPLEDITEVTLLQEKPRISRIAGTGLDNVQKGRYVSSEYGDITVLLDPREGPWLLVRTTDEKLYLFGAGNKESMTRIYSDIQKNRVP